MKALLCSAILACSATGLRAQDATGVVTDSAPRPRATYYRDPHKARILGSVFPGAGHVYAGEYLRGYLNYLGTIGGIGGGIMMYTIDRCTFSFLSANSCDPGPQWPHRTLGIAIIGTGIWTWISSARDAAHAAERANERHQERNLLVNPLIETRSQPDAELRAGLNVSW